MAKIWPCDDEESKRFPIFTRANTGEVFAVPSTPLTWSVLGQQVYENGYRDALYEMGAFVPEDFRPENEGEVVASFGGYVYINVSISRVLAVRVPGMDWRAIDQAFFGEASNVPPYRPHPGDENAECSERVVAWMGGLFAATSVPGIETVRTQIDGIVARRPDLTALSEAELVARYRSLVPEFRLAFKTHMLATYAANIVTGVVGQIGAAVGLADRVSAVTAGVGGVESVQQSLDIWALSRVVRESPALTAAFDKGVDGLVARVRELPDPDAERFLAGWNAFLDDWGFLGPNVWEMRSPTYATHLDIPLRMIDRARTVGDAGSPQARTASATRERERAVGEIAARIPDEATKGQFLAAVGVLPVHMPARENIKVQSTRLCEEARMTLRELGGRYVAPGSDTAVLETWEDVLLLMGDEIDAFVDDPAPWADTIRERRAQLRELEALWPPFIVDGTPPTLDRFTPRADDTVTAAAAGDVLTGLGVSPGEHVGRARVIRALDDDTDLDEGDILVASTTDSSWGPLFLVAGAVVCETGAVISHAAIVSRELGIPSAVSVEGAMTKLVDGMTLRVNGDDGTVTVVEVP